jgi:hypothetical protein
MWARQECSSLASSEVRSLVRIDLLGRTGPARLHLRVRFGVTDEMPTLGVSLDLWTGGNA